MGYISNLLRSEPTIVHSDCVHISPIVINDGTSTGRLLVKNKYLKLKLKAQHFKSMLHIHKVFRLSPINFQPRKMKISTYYYQSFNLKNSVLNTITCVWLL